MNKKQNTTDIFAHAPVPKAVFSNILPAIISMMMVLLYNLADTFFIGQTKNALMVAAVSVATPGFLLFIAMGLFFGIGGTSLISRLLGAEQPKKARQASAFCFWTEVFVSVVAMVLIWIFSAPLCRLLGADEETMFYVQQYLNIVTTGIPFLVVSNSFSNIIRAEGRVNTAMIGMILGNLVNIVLDPIMILGMGLNVAGAAWATVIGNVAAAAFYLVHLLSGRSMLSIQLRDYRAGDHIATGIIAIGLPASLNSLLMTISTVIINNLMLPYGNMAVAGLGVAMKVNMIVIMMLIGLANGVQPLLGFCYGAKNKARYFAVLRFSLLMAFCLSMALTAVCYLGAGPLVTAFLDDPDAYTFSLAFARIYIISGPIMGIFFVLNNALQSMGAAGPALLLSVSRQGLLFVPIIFTFNALFHSATMLAYAQPVTDYCTVAFATILFIVTAKRYFRNFPGQTDDKEKEQKQAEAAGSAAADC